MLRSAAIASVLATGMVAVAGCGNGNSTVFHADGVALTKVQISAYAAAVNLRAGDVPGLVGARFPRKRETTSGPFGSMMATCDGGVHGADKVIGYASQRFETSNAPESGQTVVFSTRLSVASVSSTVYLFSSSALASRELMLSGSLRARECLKQELMQLERKATVTDEDGRHHPAFSDPAVSVLPVPLPNMPSYGLRIALNSAFPSLFGKGRVYQDFYGVVVGPVLITLATTGAPKTFPTATERRLLALLYRRAKEHTL